MDSWMFDNVDVLGNRRLGDIILPGSHDSAAYKFSNDEGPIGPSLRDKLLYFISRIARPCIAPWILTQHWDVYRQLAEAGSRFLDVRVAWNDMKKAFITSHTFSCVPLKVLLQDAVDFLSQKSGEVVVVVVRPDWPHRSQFTNPSQREALLQTLTIACRDYLFPRQHQLPTLAEMISSGRRLIIFVEGLPSTPTPAHPRPQAIPPATASIFPCSSSRSGSSPAVSRAHNPASPQHTDPCDLLWIAAGCRTLWANSDTPEGTVSGLLDLITRLRQDDGLAGALLWYVSAAVTPTPRSVVRDLVAQRRWAGLRQLAKQLEEQELPRLLEEGLEGIGAVCLDYPSPAATRAIIRLNLTIADRDPVSVS